MQEIKVSVIVPIYNTEKFLKKCIDSIVNQTLEEIEIILINDGSTDNSHIICEEYSKKYPKKIKYINNKNIGCSASRNLGMSLAQGEYIAFVDSDDYIDKEMYQEMYEKAKKEDLDIVVCGIEVFDLNKKNIASLPKKTKDLYDKLTSRKKVANPVNKLFRREYLKNLKIIFLENTRYAEDMVFCFKLIVNTNKIGYEYKCYYHYFHHGENSIFNLEIRKDIFVSYEDLYNYLLENRLLENKKIKEKFFINYNLHVIKGVFFLLLNPKLITKEKYKKYDKLFYEELKKVKFLPIKSKVLMYYYRSIVWIIRKFNLYTTLKKLKNYFKERNT